MFQLRYRHKRGTTLGELPLGLWIVFVGIGLPLITLAAIVIRYSLFWQATREAVQAASQSQTYLTNPTYPIGTLSAVNTATSTAVTAANNFNGVSVSQVNCWVIVTPVSSTGTLTPVVYGPNTILTSVNTDSNMYQIRVTVSGQLKPLLSMSTSLIGGIPGLTQSVSVSATEERVFENPSGLTY